MKVMTLQDHATMVLFLNLLTNFFNNIFQQLDNLMLIFLRTLTFQ